MTNELQGERRPDEFELVREPTDEERDFLCFVRHEDAGGQYERAGACVVYGLQFCEVHGPEARLAALAEATHDAEKFFERFRSSHVPRQSAAIQRGLEVALDHLHADRSTGKDYGRALLHAYPASEVPERAREQVLAWKLDERPGHAPVFDTLMDSLDTLHKLLRIAFEAGETWLVEVLEIERESVAAQAAVALEDRGRQACA